MYKKKITVTTFTSIWMHTVPPPAFIFQHAKVLITAKQLKIHAMTHFFKHLN